jgi:hypothetical protein
VGLRNTVKCTILGAIKDRLFTGSEYPEQCHYMENSSVCQVQLVVLGKKVKRLIGRGSDKLLRELWWNLPVGRCRRWEGE